jgi:putative transport protein
MVWVEQFLVKYPELAVFLAISLGYLIGGVKFGGFGLGPVTGSLVPSVPLRHRLLGRTHSSCRH